MTQHAAREMAFSRLRLPTDVKVRRRFKSDIPNIMQTKSNCFCAIYKGAPRKEAGKKEQRPKYKHHILYLINTTLNYIIFRNIRLIQFQFV